MVVVDAGERRVSPNGFGRDEACGRERRSVGWDSNKWSEVEVSLWLGVGVGMVVELRLGQLDRPELVLDLGLEVDEVL